MMHPTPITAPLADERPAPKTDELIEELWFSSHAASVRPIPITRRPPPPPIGDPETDLWFR